MSYFDGLYLNEVDEIAAMREELGVRDDRIDQRPVIQLWCAGAESRGALRRGSRRRSLRSGRGMHSFRKPARDKLRGHTAAQG